MLHFNEVPTNSIPNRSAFCCCCRCTKPNQIPVHMEQLTPIDEEPSEDDANDEDQPITMIPKIMHTAPSPTTDNPPTSNVTSTTTVNHEQTPKHSGDSAVKLNTSATEPTISEVTIEEEHEKKQSIPIENDTNNGTSEKDNEFSQIESVL